VTSANDSMLESWQRGSGAGIRGWAAAALRPLQQRIERRTKGLPPGREVVFHLRRHLAVDDPMNDSIGFQLAKLLHEHLLRDRRNRAFQVRKTQDFAAKKMEQDQQLPAALDKAESLLYALRGGNRRVVGALTFR
jgi:hypothetical protein